MPGTSIFILYTVVAGCRIVTSCIGKTELFYGVFFGNIVPMEMDNRYLLKRIA